MNIVNLLSAFPSANNLADLSQKLDSVLGGMELEERESSNYVGGRYYSGHIGNIRMILALSDETDHDDLPYWIALSSNETTEDELITFADEMATARLLPAGLRVARFVSFGRVDEQRINY